MNEAQVEQMQQGEATQREVMPEYNLGELLSLLEKEEEAILTLVEVGEGVVLDAFDRIEAVYQKEYAEWKEGDERLRRMHEEHLTEYTERVAKLEDLLEEANSMIGNEEEDERWFHADVREYFVKYGYLLP